MLDNCLIWSNPILGVKHRKGQSRSPWSGAIWIYLYVFAAALAEDRKRQFRGMVVAAWQATVRSCAGAPLEISAAPLGAASYSDSWGCKLSNHGVSGNRILLPAGGIPGLESQELGKLAHRPNMARLTQKYRVRVMVSRLWHRDFRVQRGGSQMERVEMPKEHGHHQTGENNGSWSNLWHQPQTSASATPKNA